MRKILEEEGYTDNTVFVFMSDHGCHFMTRNQEYKRSTHNSSLRVPMIVDGPGFESARQIQEIVGIVDLTPTLLDAAGVPVPQSMKGHSFLPLVHDAKARQTWPNQQLIQISESMTGRSIRTKDWTYCIADPTGATSTSASTNYHEYQLYDQRNDPNELVNLSGRKEYRQTADQLREQTEEAYRCLRRSGTRNCSGKTLPLNLRIFLSCVPSHGRMELALFGRKVSDQ